MSAKIIRPKDNRLPCFILPDYEDGKQSFYPFTRLKEPNNIYETLKKYILTIFIVPLRGIGLIMTLCFMTTIALIGTIGFDPTNLNDLCATLPLWRKICFKILRWTGTIALFFYGFHNVSIKHYSYKDMKNKFDYVPPINIQYDEHGNELHPRCNIVASNHLGFADILFLLSYFNGSFVSKKAIKDVFGIGAICKSMQGIFVEKGKSTTHALIKRVNFMEDIHSNRNCSGCSLCLSNVCIFPEGTTTNGNDLIMFRTGVFNSGLPIRPIIIKPKWKSCNTTWETIYFRTLSWKVLTQFTNYLDIIIGPPYIPTNEEKEDSALYAYNMNILMAQMMGLNNDGRKPNIYLMNRDIKINCYHKCVCNGTNINTVCNWAKEKAKRDLLINKYLNMIKNDKRYMYNGIENDNGIGNNNDDKKLEGVESQFNYNEKKKKKK
eukprot:427762_1